MKRLWIALAVLSLTIGSAFAQVVPFDGTQYAIPAINTPSTIIWTPNQWRTAMASFQQYGGTVSTASATATSGTTNTLAQWTNYIGPSVLNNAGLKALLAGGYPSVLRLGFATAGDGGTALYTWSGSNCTINAGAGDNGAQVKPTTGIGCWILASGGSGAFDSKIWGVTGNGTTDDSAALTAVITYVSGLGAGTVIVPSSPTRSATGITIPQGVTVMTRGWNPSNPYSGGSIVCDLSVMACVTLSAGTSGSTTVGGIGLSDITVGRAAGTPPSGSIGVLVKDAYNVFLTNVLSTSSAIGFQAQDDSGHGITLTAYNIQTSAITDAHFVDNSWPEIKISHSRFGTNGSIDPTCNAFMRFTGGTNGPNTVTVDGGTQFNLGSGNNCGTWLDFSNWGSGAGTIISEFTFIGDHVEDVNHFVQTDATVTTLNRLTMIGDTLLDNAGSAEFWNLNAATAITDSRLIGNNIGAHTFTLPGHQPMSHLLVEGNNFNPSAVSVTGSGSGTNTVDFTGNTFDSGLTIAGNFSVAHFSGILDGPGSLSNTATGFVAIDIPGQLSNCTLALTFGGASTGITYSANRCHWQMQGSLVTVAYDIELSSKGSATGSAGISGMPINSSAVASWGGQAVSYMFNMFDLTGAVTLSPVAGAETANFYQTNSTGVGDLIDSEFTNTSKLIGSFTYSVAP